MDSAWNPPDSSAIDCEEMLIEEAAETEKSDAQGKMENARDRTVGVAKNLMQYTVSLQSAIQRCQRSEMPV